MGDEPSIERASRSLKPVNLTAAAEPVSWAEASRINGLPGPGDGATLEVHALSPAESARRYDGLHDTVYVVAAGFGVLRHGDVAMECTAGDVLFVPKGCPHRFERLDGEIRIWRISPAAS